MKTVYHAQPYDIEKTGFYFTDLDSYQKGVEASGAEEFELQFIDGSSEDAQLFSACGINQANLEQWFDSAVDLAVYDKAALFYLCSDVGYSLEDALDKVEDVSLYYGALSDAAAELFDECYLADVPESVQAYIDYDKFARDCEIGGDMSEFQFGGDAYTVTNASCI